MGNPAGLGHLGVLRQAGRRARISGLSPTGILKLRRRQLRQICIDYLPGSLEHHVALPSDLAAEPVLDGRSARQVLDEQLALIESRLDLIATHSYRREADELLTHARFVADSLRPDPFQARLAELATAEPETVAVAAPEPVHAADGSPVSDEAAARTRARA